MDRLLDIIHHDIDGKWIWMNTNLVNGIERKVKLSQVKDGCPILIELTNFHKNKLWTNPHMKKLLANGTYIEQAMFLT